MDIIIVDKSLCQICECQSNKDLEIKIRNCFLEHINDLQLSDEIIKNIVIAHMDESFGRVDIASITPLTFNIFISRNIIFYLFNEKEDKRSLALAVIYHELIHCKAIHKISIANIDLVEFFDTLKGINNQRDLYMDIGYYQWQEYYAHFYSSKVYPSSITDLSIINCENIYSTLKRFSIEDMFCERPTCVSTYNEFVYPFVEKLIILLANKNSINSESHIKELHQYELISNEFNDYIVKVNAVLIKYFITYPTWISKQKFYELGKVLLDVPK